MMMAARPLLAVLAALGAAGILIALSGADPILAYRAMLLGAFGSVPQFADGLAKATPYLLCATGIALCFRARVINIGADGQIACGAMAATATAQAWPIASPFAACTLALLAGAAGGAAWAGLAAVLHLARQVNAVLVTLLLNFVALLLVGQALEGPLGEPGAGFPQSPLLPRADWLPRLLAHTSLHAGILLALVVAVAGHVLLWRTRWGFGLRSIGASRKAALYAGFPVPRTVAAAMLFAGGTAGLAGAVQVMAIHHRLIDGFATGFGFVSVTVALLGGLNPLALIPSALFFGFLETGALSMQRQVGVPSSLVSVIEGLTMLFVLAAMGGRARQGRV